MLPIFAKRVQQTAGCARRGRRARCRDAGGAASPASAGTYWHHWITTPADAEAVRGEVIYGSMVYQRRFADWSDPITVTVAN